MTDFFRTWIAVPLLSGASALGIVSADSVPVPGWTAVDPGPWGNVEYVEVILEPPAASWIQLLVDRRDQWHFPGFSREAVMEQMQEFGLSDQWMEVLADDALWGANEEGCIVHPPARMMIGLPEEHRQVIYGWQYELGLREFFRYTVTLERDFLELMSDLPGDWLDIIGRSGYQLGGSYCVSGVSWIEEVLGSRADTVKLVCAMARTRAVVARLRVDSGSDLNALVQYWGAGGLNPGAKAFLGSVKPTTGPVLVDLVNLLPAVPRRYLNTFLVQHDIWLDTAPDCFWSTVNFFERRPSARALDPVTFAHYVMDTYEEVAAPKGLGDVVVLFSENGKDFVHCYVHVAGEIVFTKNGSSPMAPWILMREEDMMSRYQHLPIVPKAYRRLPAS